jgi:hypothetical protein
MQVAHYEMDIVYNNTATQSNFPLFRNSFPTHFSFWLTITSLCPESVKITRIIAIPAIDSAFIFKIAQPTG